MTIAVETLSLQALEERVARLDAKVKVSPGQLGLDFSAPPAAPPKPKPAAASKGKGRGEPCGQGWISRDKECHKNGPTGSAKPGQEKEYKPTPQNNAPLSAGGLPHGWNDYDVAQERENNKGGLKFWRSRDGRRPAYFYFFRDRAAAEHWLSEDNARADADNEVGPGNRRSKEWQAAYKESYNNWRNIFSKETSDYDLLKSVEAYALSGKATHGGTVVDVRIAGNKHSRPVREGMFAPKPKQQGSEKDKARLVDQLTGYGIKLTAEQVAQMTFGDVQEMLKAEGAKWAAKRKPKTQAEPVLTNPDRYDPGLAPKAKPAGISAQDVTTSTGQAQLARQQRKAAEEAGDQKGAAAWRQEERAAERDRLQGAISRGQQSQASLFGVTEYDETMPLFRQREDSFDPVAQLCGSILREQLPGAQVLDWSRHPRGITAGRAVAEGLVYRFRLDADSIGYKPAWEGINEQQWELRSEGFLAARDPSVRLDYRRGGVKFQQKTTKRKCSKGYGCGAACISLNKECRIQPKSAISKVRLKQLQALAQEGDQKAAAQAQDLQMQRDAKAQSLQKGRQTSRLEKMLEDPRVAEMVRTGRVPEAQGAQGAIQPGKVRDMAPDDIEVDAERFQYKLGASAKGEVGSLSGVQKWDPNLAGVISVWRDPANGVTYVVNGHNRLALAKRLGAKEVTVRYLDAKDAREARAIGAMQNIAEGQGKETDAAKFFRDSGITTMEEVQKRGLPLNSGKAARGLALAQLPDEMFQDVIQGKLKVRRAAVIGGSGLDQDKQREVYKMLKARPSMTDETLQEYVEHLAVSLRQTQTEMTLFGTSQKSVDTGLARAELSNGLKKALGREARLLGAVSKNSAAVELLEQRGGNVINVEQSQQEAQEASSVLRVFNQLKNLSGPVKTALDRAAVRLTAGESRSKVQRELREQVIEAMEEELKRLGLRKEPAPPVDTQTINLFDAADDRFDAAIDRLTALSIRLDQRCKRPDGSFYGTSGVCRKGKLAGAARSLGERVKTLGRRLLGRGQKPSEGDVMAAAERIQQMAAARKKEEAERQAKERAREEELLSRGPQKWGVKQVEKEEVRGSGDEGIVWHESRYEVQLEEPLRLPARPGKGMRLVDKLSFGVAVEPANAKPIARKLGEQGVNLSNGQVRNALELAWLAGAGGGEAFMGADRMELPKNVARKFAMAVSKQIKGVVSNMEEGQIVICQAYEDDGYGDKRRSLYERAGFTFIDGTGIAVVRNGRLSRIEGARGDRLDAGDQIDLDGLIVALLTLGGATR